MAFGGSAGSVVFGEFGEGCVMAVVWVGGGLRLAHGAPSTTYSFYEIDPILLIGILVTVGGLATYNEMCVVTISYYPRVSAFNQYCLSSVVEGTNGLLHQPICGLLSPVDLQEAIAYEPLPVVNHESTFE